MRLNVYRIVLFIGHITDARRRRRRRQQHNLCWPTGRLNSVLRSLNESQSIDSHQFQFN